jgi:hypothetical protein
MADAETGGLMKIQPPERDRLMVIVRRINVLPAFSGELLISRHAEYIESSGARLAVGTTPHLRFGTLSV